jgi:hypothetical protein
MGVLDGYLIDPRLSLLDKTRIQAQVLVPVLKRSALNLGRRRLTRPSSRLCAIGQSSCSQPWATVSMVAGAVSGRRCTPPWLKVPSTMSRWRCAAMIRKRWNLTSAVAGSQSSFARSASPSSAPC